MKVQISLNSTNWNKKGGNHPAVPSQMAAPGVSAAGPNDLTVMRAPPPVSSGAPIQSYDMRHSTDQANWTVVSGISDPEALTGLASDTTYFIQTRAVNTVGNGAWSQSGSAATAAVQSVPGQMGAPVVASSGTTALSVDRAAAPSDGGSVITSYDLRHSTDQASWTVVSGISDPEALTGLASDTTYFVQTRAANAVGSGAWSPSGSAATAAVQTVPGQMGAPGVAAISHNEIVANLATAPADGGSTITSFDLRFSTDQATWTDASDISDPHAIPGLTAATQYFVQTRAVNAIGVASWSASASVTTNAFPEFYDLAAWELDVPVNASGAKTGLNDAAEIQNGSELDGYESVWFQRDPAHFRFVVDSDGSLTSTAGFPRCELQEASFNRAADAASEHKVVVAVQQLQAGTRSMILQAHNATSADFKLEIRASAPGGANGDVIFRYRPVADGAETTVFLRTDVSAAVGGVHETLSFRVRRYPTHVDVFHGTNVDGTTPDWTTGDPSPVSGGPATPAFLRTATDSAYRWQCGNYLQTNQTAPVLTSILDHVAGTWAAPKALAAGAPGQMTAPSVAATGSSTLSVDRAVAPADNGWPITSYDLRHSTDQTNWTVVTGVSDPEALSGLQPSTTYFAQTRAVNAGGAGNWSASGSASTTTAATAPAQMAAPLVSGQSATAISVDRATAPNDGGSPITSYDLRHSTDQATWTVVTGVSDPQTVSGLGGSTTYFAQTRAVNAIGAGAWSVSGSAVTQSAGGSADVARTAEWGDATPAGEGGYRPYDQAGEFVRLVSYDGLQSGSLGGATPSVNAGGQLVFNTTGGPDAAVLRCTGEDAQVYDITINEASGVRHIGGWSDVAAAANASGAFICDRRDFHFEGVDRSIPLTDSTVWTLPAGLSRNTDGTGFKYINVTSSFSGVIENLRLLDEQIRISSGANVTAIRNILIEQTVPGTPAAAGLIHIQPDAHVGTIEKITYKRPAIGHGYSVHLIQQRHVYLGTAASDFGSIDILQDIVSPYIAQDHIILKGSKNGEQVMRRTLLGFGGIQDEIPTNFWNSSTTYNTGDHVMYAHTGGGGGTDEIWVSKINNNQGNQPIGTNSFDPNWELRDLHSDCCTISGSLNGVRLDTVLLYQKPDQKNGQPDLLSLGVNNAVRMTRNANDTCTYNGVTIENSLSIRPNDLPSFSMQIEDQGQPNWANAIRIRNSRFTHKFTANNPPWSHSTSYLYSGADGLVEWSNVRDAETGNIVADPPELIASGVPGAFSSGNWTLADKTTGDALTVTITGLPSQGGSAITVIHYRVNGGNWTSLGGNSIGSYDVTGLPTGLQASIELRAVNSSGAGAASSAKTATPTGAVSGVSLVGHVSLTNTFATSGSTSIAGVSAAGKALIAVFMNNGTDPRATSVTVGGVSATRVEAGSTPGVGYDNETSLWEVSGAFADDTIDITSSASMDDWAIAAFDVTGKTLQPGIGLNAIEDSTVASFGGATNCLSGDTLIALACCKTPPVLTGIAAGATDSFPVAVLGNEGAYLAGINASAGAGETVTFAKDPSASTCHGVVAVYR